MADGLQVSGDLVATTSGATGQSYGGVGQGLWLNFFITSASSNTVDTWIDITSSGAVASSSASYRLRPGKSFPPYIVSAAGRNAGYSGFSAISSSSAFLSWIAWR